ncbi:MAG TPA: cation-transporting P-type ATPase, partial [Gaiellaceae bacterium]|nr:cation-transporting P-type ATPase [Gaiellaceae bacterium]
MSAVSAPLAGAPSEDKQWFALDSAAVAQELGTDEQAGLAPAEAATRLEKYGANAFVAAETEPRWHAFVRQYRDPMQIVLLVAGIGSIWPLHEL